MQSHHVKTRKPFVLYYHHLFASLLLSLFVVLYKENSRIDQS